MDDFRLFKKIDYFALVFFRKIHTKYLKNPKKSFDSVIQILHAYLNCFHFHCSSHDWMEKEKYSLIFEQQKECFTYTPKSIFYKCIYTQFIHTHTHFGYFRCKNYRWQKHGSWFLVNQCIIYFSKNTICLIILIKADAICCRTFLYLSR